MAEKIYDIRKRTYEFAKATILFLRTLPADFISQTLGKQLLRAATSVGANIIEAQAAPSKRDFANFYNYSLKSANESQYWLRLIQDSCNPSTQKIRMLLSESKEIANILGAILLKIRKGNS